MSSTRSTRAEEDDDAIEVTSSTSDKEVTDSEEEHSDSERSTSDSDSESDDDSDTSDTPGQRGQLRFKTTKPNTQKPIPTVQSAIKYRHRRLAITVKIQEVESNSDCLFKLAASMNEFLKHAKKKNKHFRLRRFDDLSAPDPKDRTSWQTKVSNSSATDFMAYVYGYYPSANPRGGMFRLRINSVMDAALPLPRFLKDIMHDWGHTDSHFIADLKAQSIWDPIKVGYLMRAPRFLTHSYELLDALEATPQAKKNKINFGVSWATIPSPVGGYDRETAVQAVMIETNKADVQKAVTLLKRWYPLNPKSKAQPPYPGNFRFVLNRDNDAIEGNPVAKKHLSTLMARQGIFNNMTKGSQTYCLQSLEEKWEEGNPQSIRDKLLATKIITSKDKDLQGGQLFQTVSSSINNQTGQKSTWFTYHQNNSAEAMSVVKNLPIFIKTEWQIDPSEVCYEQYVMEGEEWDNIKRVAQNEDTKELALAAEVYTLDLKEAQEESVDEETQSLNSKARREMKRTVYGDEETIISISQAQPKKPRNTPASIEIGDAKSQGAISGVSGTSSRTSVLRERFQTELQAQESRFEQMETDRNKEMEKTESLQQQLAQMQAMMVTMQQQMQQASQENIAHANDAASQSSKSDKDRSDSEPEFLPVPNEEHTAVTPNETFREAQQHLQVTEEDMTIENIIPFNLTAALREPLPEDDTQTAYEEIYQMIYDRMITLESNPDDEEQREQIQFNAQEEATRLCNPSFDSSNTLLEKVQKREDRRDKLVETEKELTALEASTDHAETAYEDIGSDEEYLPARGEKRLAATNSTELEDKEDQFIATSSTRSKKKQNAPGEADPGFHC